MLTLDPLDRVVSNRESDDHPIRRTLPTWICLFEWWGGLGIDVSYGMVFGMATAKITITLRDEQVESIRALVAAGKARSVSAFVGHAVGVALDDAAGWNRMLEDALQQTGGPLTEKEREWADALLAPERQKGRKRPAA